MAVVESKLFSHACLHYIKWEFKAVSRPMLPLLLCIVTLSWHTKWAVMAKPRVPCHFVFGDSLADNGNNNQQMAGFKANFWPYGMDYSGGPTGRFCNGRTTIDLIEEHLGFETPSPPFLTSDDANILRGLNYASGGSGLRDDTGFPGLRTSMSGQLNSHRTTVSRIRNMLGSTAAEELLGKCIYSISSGNNDYIANYFLPLSQTSLRFTPDQYASALVRRYSEVIKTLYKEGARKMVLYGLAQLGCAPFVIISHHGINGTGCVKDISESSIMFNRKLLNAVDGLNNDLRGAKITYINASAELMNLLGPVVTTTTCCEVEQGALGCIPNGNTCPNRDKVVFFDAFHPTEASNIVFAEIAYSKRGLADAHPYDISELAGL